MLYSFPGHFLNVFNTLFVQCVYGNELYTFPVKKMYSNPQRNVLVFEWAKGWITRCQSEVWHHFHIVVVICHVHFSLETISDQSDIESRIKALKEELKKRKLMASELKKEQKKRHKERLKAEEASLLKQLEVNMMCKLHLNIQLNLNNFFSSMDVYLCVYSYLCYHSVFYLDFTEL